MADDWRPGTWREVVAGDILVIAMGVFGAGAAGRAGVVLGVGVAMAVTLEFATRRYREPSADGSENEVT
ncbi:MAG: hypothetical protein ACNS61_07505 [Candidatus Wenzhouxiangella sp. M2_3B_020]